MTKEELINTLEIAKAEVEWDQPLIYSAAIDEAIKYIKALDKACELLEHFDSPTVRVNKRTKKEWKEWLLKDER